MIQVVSHYLHSLLVTNIEHHVHALNASINSDHRYQWIIKLLGELWNTMTIGTSAQVNAQRPTSRSIIGTILGPEYGMDFIPCPCDSHVMSRNQSFRLQFLSQQDIPETPQTGDVFGYAFDHIVDPSWTVNRPLSFRTRTLCVWGDVVNTTIIVIMPWSPIDHNRQAGVSVNCGCVEDKF